MNAFIQKLHPERTHCKLREIKGSSIRTDKRRFSDESVLISGNARPINWF